MIIVSRDSINCHLRVVIGVPTTHRANLRVVTAFQVELKKGVGGLTMDSVALCEKVRAIDKSGFVHRMGSLPENEMRRIEAALRVVMNL